MDIKELRNKYLLEELSKTELDDIDISYIVLKRDRLEAIFNNQGVLLNEIKDFKYEGHRATLIYERNLKENKIIFDLLDEDLASKIIKFINVLKKAKQNAFIRFYIQHT